MRGAVWLDAIAIGRAILRSAKRDISTVRHVLSVFATTATLDRQIVLTVDTEKHLHFAGILIAFVRELEIDDLEIGLVAYKNNKGVHADLDDLCRRLELAPNSTPTRAEMARNAHADSPARQAGLEVLRVTRASAVTDQAFFFAMILGAAVEVSRFALPAASLSTAATYGQDISNPPRPLDPDPMSKMPPASAPGRVDQDVPRESVQRGGPN